MFLAFRMIGALLRRLFIGVVFGRDQLASFPLAEAARHAGAECSKRYFMLSVIDDDMFCSLDRANNRIIKEGIGYGATGLPRYDLTLPLGLSTIYLFLNFSTSQLPRMFWWTVRPTDLQPCMQMADFAGDPIIKKKRRGSRTD